jgi:type I restriction enzyme S subunit
MIKVKEDNIFNIRSLPENWRICKLEDAVNIIGGSQPPKKTFKTEYENGYVRLIQIRDYKSERFLTYVPINSTKKFCSKNDVMIGRYGPPVFQILRGLEGAYNVALMKAEPKNNMYSEYLFHLLTSKPVQDLVINNSKRTAGQTGVNLRLLNNCLIPLPPIPQQKKIANILDAADALRQNDKALIAKYDELTQALFLDMFGDPVSNPKGLEKVKFLDLFNIETGKLDSNHSVINGKYPFFTCAKEVLAINSFSYDKEALLLAGNNAAGVYDVKHYIGKFDAYQRTYILTLDPTLRSYLFYKLHLELKLKDLQKLSIGSSTKYLTMKIFERIEFLSPPLELQYQFAERVAVIEEQKAIAQKSFEKSESLFNSLLQKAFKGEF